MLVPGRKGDSPLLISVMRYKHRVLSFSLIFLSKAPISPFCYRLVSGINVHVASAVLPKVLNAFPDTIPIPVAGLVFYKRVTLHLAVFKMLFKSACHQWKQFCLLLSTVIPAVGLFSGALTLVWGMLVLTCCLLWKFWFLLANFWFPWSGRELEYSLNWKGEALTCDWRSASQNQKV